MLGQRTNAGFSNGSQNLLTNNNVTSQASVYQPIVPSSSYTGPQTVPVSSTSQGLLGNNYFANKSMYLFCSKNDIDL